jgi:hypothetical protein
MGAMGGGLSAEEFEAVHGIAPMRGGAVSATWYGLPIQYSFDGTDSVDWDTNTIKVSLHTSSYTPNEDTHDYVADLSAEVANGNGYTTGGVTLGSKTVTLDTTNNRLELSAANAQWTSASFTARYAVVYKSTGNSATALLLGYVDFGGDETVSSGTFTITWDAEGILQISY